MGGILSEDFLRFAIPASGAVVAWFVNERRKRAADDFVRKERKYEALVESVQGFYVNLSSTPEGKKLRESFLKELNKCWLYCPDEVIKKAYAFLATVTVGDPQPDPVKEVALGDLMVAIRKDLFARTPTRQTSLTARDFKHLKTPE